MEVKVTDTFGLDDNVLVSIRYGTIRRQAPLESVKAHPFKFDKTLEEISEPLKIDLLKPMASTRLVLHPREEEYSIGFEQADNIAMALHVTNAEGPGPGPGAKESSSKDSAANAKDYLEQKGLLKYVQSLLHAVIQDKPEDPFSYMIEQLTAAQSKSQTCERVMSRPTSARPSRPTSAVARPAGSRPASARPNPPKQRPVDEAPAPREDPPPFPEIPEDRPLKDTKDPAVARKLQELDQSADKKKELMRKLLTATENGQLGTVLASVGLEHSRRRIQALLEQSAESGELEAALKMVMNQKELMDAQKAKSDMRGALEEASETEMRAVLGEMKSQRQMDEELAETDRSANMKLWQEIEAENERLKRQLRDTLLEADASGKMRTVLEEMVGAKDANAQELQDSKDQLKTVLVEASESGKKKEALQQMLPQEPAEPASVAPLAVGDGVARQDERHAVKKKLCGAMLDAAESGKLAEVLDGRSTTDPGPVTAAPAAGGTGAAVKAEDELLRENVKAKMQESLANGRLEEGLATLARKKSQEPEKRPEEDLKKLGQEICGVLQQASQSGKLDEALELLKQEQQEVMRAAPEDEMDAVRKNLCSLMQDAMLSGQLAVALEELKMKSEDIKATDVAAIKAKFRKLLREALESGTLASKVGKLKLIPKAPSPPKGPPPDEMDLLKLHLREALQHAAEAGHLAEALASLQKGPSGDVVQTKLQLQSVLTEAALSGTLGDTLRSLRKEGQPKGEQPPAVAEPSATPVASPTAEEVPYGTKPAEEKELEELRGRLRKILSGAYDQGVLEQVVQDAVKKTHGESDELPALKAQVAQMRKESESLHSTVERLQREKQELERVNEDLATRLTK